MKKLLAKTPAAYYSWFGRTLKVYSTPIPLLCASSSIDPVEVGASSADIADDAQSAGYWTRFVDMYNILPCRLCVHHMKCWFRQLQTKKALFLNRPKVPQPFNNERQCPSHATSPTVQYTKCTIWHRQKERGYISRYKTLESTPQTAQIPLDTTYIPWRRNGALRWTGQRHDCTKPIW